MHDTAWFAGSIIRTREVLSCESCLEVFEPGLLPAEASFTA